MRRLAYELSKPVFEDKIKLKRGQIGQPIAPGSVTIGVREDSPPPCQNLSLDITVTFWEHRSRWVGPKTRSLSPAQYTNESAGKELRHQNQ